MPAPAALVTYYADLAENVEGPGDLPTVEQMGARRRRWIEHEASGVVSAIITDNFPARLAMAKLAPAPAPGVGCTVVPKGAPDTPLRTLALAMVES